MIDHQGCRGVLPSLVPSYPLRPPPEGWLDLVLPRSATGCVGSDWLIAGWGKISQQLPGDPQAIPSSILGKREM